jgi:acetyl esterase/lipase
MFVFKTMTVIGAALVVVASSAHATSVRVVRDLPYISDGSPKHTLDVYAPDGQRGAPVIVSLYGGGLTAGDKNQQAFVGQRFASAGIVTAVVNYRLTPEVAHPAHVRDAAAAVAWAKQHAADYGGDASRLFVIGHSAGAYLAALLATDEHYLAAEHLSLSDIRGVVPVSAFYWVERADVAPARDKRVWGPDAAKWADASPAHHLHARVPPMLILYADGDDAWRRDQNVEAAQALKGAGNTAIDIAQIRGRTHNSIWSRMGEEGDEVADRIIRFVKGASTKS